MWALQTLQHLCLPVVFMIVNVVDSFTDRLLTRLSNSSKVAFLFQFMLIDKKIVHVGRIV